MVFAGQELLNAYWSMKRVFFSKLGKIGRRVAKQQLIQSGSCFSVTMVSRFKIVDEEYLKDKGENENTKNSTEKKWANERNLQANLEEYEINVLDQRLLQY